jgi:hypothetical protein
MTTSAVRLTIALLAVLALLTACEAVGSPDEYKTKICGATAELSGPLAGAVDALDQAVTARDLAAITSARDDLETSVNRIGSFLVDVPLWEPGQPVTSDLRAVVAAYHAAIGQLNLGIATGDPGQLDAAMAAIKAAPDAAPNLGQHITAARVVGLNC